MSRATALRWGIATAAFLVIGVLGMRFGHTVAFGLLIVSLIGVFALDLAAKRRERGVPGGVPGDAAAVDGRQDGAGR